MNEISHVTPRISGSRDATPRLLQLFLGFWMACCIPLLVRANDTARDYVVIVLDASGSMAGKISPDAPLDRMTAAKQALLKVSRRIPTNTHIGLLVFSDPRLKDDWVYPLGPRDPDRLRQAILRPQPGAGTPLGAYLKKGADRLLEMRTEQHGYGTYRLIVVTDGEAQDADLVDRYTPEITRKGMTLDVIGVGMAQRHTLARHAHSYRAANDPAALDRALSEVFAEVGGAGGRNAVTAADFDLLRSIPLPVAAAALEALGKVENTPIGVAPVPPNSTNAPAAQRAGRQP